MCGFSTRFRAWLVALALVDALPACLVLGSCRCTFAPLLVDVQLVSLVLAFAWLCLALERFALLMHSLVSLVLVDLLCRW